MADYPATDYDIPTTTSWLLGGFWNDVFGGAGQVSAYAGALGEQSAELVNRMGELAALASRATAPVFHHRRWYPITILASEKNVGAERYGTPGLNYGPGPIYGGPLPGQVNGGTYYPAPTGLASACLMSDQLSSPLVTLEEGIDYFIDRVEGLIRFRSDPFNDARWSTIPLTSNGVTVDRQVILWAWEVDFDRNYVYDQYGSAINLPPPVGGSTPAYRDLVSAMFDCIVAGPSPSSVDKALEAIAGAPVPSAPGTVAAVVVDALAQHVITEDTVYTFSPAAGILVDVGDAISIGQAVADVIRIDEFNHGTVPDGLNALTMGLGLLVVPGSGDLTFVDDSLPVTVGALPTGQVRLSVPLRGNPLDVDAFWDDAAVRGFGTVLMPTPTVINPLGLICSSVLRTGAFLVRLRTEALGPGAAGLGYLARLALLIASDTSMIVLVEPPTGQTRGQMPASGAAGTMLGAVPAFTVGGQPAFGRSRAWATGPNC